MTQKKLTVIEEAWLLVGQFMYCFSRIEDALNEAIRRAMKLNPAAYELVTGNIDFSKKVDVLKALVNLAEDRISSDKRQNMLAALNQSMKFNDDRVIVAHYAFEPAEAGLDGVVFIHTKARQKFQREDKHWSKEAFEVKTNAMIQNSLDIKNMLFDLAGYDWDQMPDRRMTAFIAAVSRKADQQID